MAFEEDFDQFIDPADFGEEFRRGTDIFYGIFDNETYTVEGEGDVGVDTQQPMILVKDSDISNWIEGEVITRVLTSVDYIVRTFAPDGTGMTQLGLSKA